MNEADRKIAEGLNRRQFLRMGALLGMAGVLDGYALSAMAEGMVEMPFANGQRPLTRRFPQKGEMVLLRTRPPLLETPFSVYDRGVFTPNDRFYVRWHLADIPTRIDVHSFRLRIHGHVNRPVSFTLQHLIHDFEPVEIVAVNQCSGNSRGFFQPRVAGGEWGNGAMGNARWTGVRLKDVLAKAGVNSGAVQVRFNGLEKGVTPKTPDFMKSLSVDHAMDGEVMLAYAMNGKPLPLLNGFPVRLVVPGWYATYWVKMLNDIEVLDKPDDNFWMSKAYLIPDTPGATMTPGEKVKMVPINKMVPRSFITNLKNGSRIHAGRENLLRGIAFGGDSGVRQVLVSSDGGRHWQAARLGKDYGKYGFRTWESHFKPGHPGETVLMVKTVNDQGRTQPDKAIWNPAGFMQNVIEKTIVRAV